MDINWEDLQDLAISAMEQAYCPYSGFPVGAAGLTTDGQTYSGCCLVLMPEGVMTMKQVLPGAFGPHDLTEVPSARFNED